MAILPFKRKPTAVPSDPKVPKAPSLSFDGCHFVDNNVGLLAGDGVNIEMKDSHFNGNQIAVMAGTIDAKILAALGQFSRSDRAKAYLELEEIANAPNIEQRQELIKKSTLADRLSTIANATTIAEWVSEVVAGANSQLGLSDLFKSLIG
jgi:hypothetical protein